MAVLGGALAVWLWCVINAAGPGNGDWLDHALQHTVQDALSAHENLPAGQGRPFSDQPADLAGRQPDLPLGQ